jgi:predicted lipoprotein with Yx(FWY)xxD motif
MVYRRIASAAGLSAVASLVLSAAAWSASVEITTASKAPFGTHLTDSAGRTVYMFTADTNGSSMCSGPCTTLWPPVLTEGPPTAGSAVQAGALGTIKHGNAEQVTYDRRPLYYFVGDGSAGSTAGEGMTNFGGSWYVLSPAGKGILPTGKELAASGAR